MKIDKVNNQEEIKQEHNVSTEIKSGEQSEFQALLNENAMNNFAIASQGLNLIQTDLAMELDSLSISEEDAQFFYDLTKNPQFAVSNVQNQLLNLGELTSSTDMQVYKPMQVSKGLFNLISKAQETQKSVRLDFDNNVTVIMKVDKDGKLMAEFIPGDKAVEEYLRNNIPFLKQKFEAQNIVYNDIYYRQNSRGQQQRNNKGESENE